ncbi:activating signal cointegrator 1 complex subunit 1-like [Onthophagus taurus]|uniref:activating signal cointegrator 1 complex subunit 1-like n=1 Tax=Onthophagus taurus TaxID=166361 RepID=UPI0039BE99D8
MDILNSRDPKVFNQPELVRIGNNLFRRYPVEMAHKSDNQLGPYTDNDDEMINCAELDDDVEIKVTKSGQFLTKIHVAPFFFGFIIGTRGSKRKEIEMDTNTRIKIPKQGETGDIVITGSSERDICSARLRINLIVLQMREKHQVTHFLSIPLVSDQINKNFEIFKSKLMSGPPLRGVEESIFISPQKLHLTLATFVLLDDYEIDNAVGVMHECQSEILHSLFKNAPPLKIVMEGIEIMNDDPTSVDVLYGKVKLDVQKYNSSLQKMSDLLVDQFAKKGIIRKQYDSVKLHATLMNSRYRNAKISDERNNGRREQRESFDASFILDKYKNFYFGEADFKEIHLSVRFTTGDDKYYECCKLINL